MRVGALIIARRYTYAELEHAQVLPQDSTMYADAVEGALAAVGLVRKVAVWQPSFLAIVAVVARAELFAGRGMKLAYSAQLQLRGVSSSDWWGYSAPTFVGRGQGRGS